MRTHIAAANVRLKRAYEPATADDGTRVLIDRLWPRGVSKDAAALDLWLKDVAPTTALRKWFGHDPARWAAFQQRYADELQQHPEAFEQLRGLARQGLVTLVFAARDEQHNDAVVLRSLLLGRGITG
ncbi:MAG: DUF488 domain-containing protein [Burkholderiaceae bacterium]